MEKYEYKAVTVQFDTWKGRPKDDYLQIINDLGMEGWRFLEFVPQTLKPSGTKKGMDLLFERKIALQ